MSFEFGKLLIGVLLTLGLYSVLYRENKFYRMVEHIYIGLAVGFAMVALWTETLEASFWKPLMGTAAKEGAPGVPGFFLYALLIPVGLMGYMVFSKKHNWMSRIPIGVILGFSGGQQLQVFWSEYGPQIQDSMRPVLPTATNSFFVPNGIQLSQNSVTEIATGTGVTPQFVSTIAQNAQLKQTDIIALAQNNGLTVDQVKGVIAAVLGKINSEIYFSQAINNIIYLVTLLSVLSYFLFSFKQEGKFISGFTKLGRWLIMVGFGAIFGSTVMTRFALLIDRLQFVLVEFLRDGIPTLWQR